MLRKIITADKLRVQVRGQTDKNDGFTQGPVPGLQNYKLTSKFQNS